MPGHSVSRRGLRWNPRAAGSLAVLKAVIAAFVITGAIAGCAAPKAPEPPPAEPTVELQPATVEQLHAAIQAGGARVVLLNVWATWCVPCREEFPDLLRIRREYRERGLRLVLVSGDFDEEIPAARKFLKEQGVDFLTYIKQGDDMTFINGIDSLWSGAMPATVLYDASGRKLWFREGKTSYDSLKARIDPLLVSRSGPTP